MLGIILIYFLGKAYYDLAGQFDKTQWGSAIFGVITYYVGTFIIGVAIYVGFDLFSTEGIVNEDVLSLMSVPGGLFACWAAYQLLERHWINEKESINSDILDDGF